MAPLKTVEPWKLAGFRASQGKSPRRARHPLRVTSVPLAALVAPDGTTSAYVSTHTDKEQDMVTLAFSSVMEPQRGRPSWPHTRCQRIVSP